MLKKSAVSLALTGLLSLVLISFHNPDTTCQVYGKVSDTKTGEAIPFANIGLCRDTMVVYSATTDINGEYCLKGVTDGIYKLKVTTIGYLPKVVESLTVKASASTKLDVKLNVSQVSLKSLEVRTEEQLAAPSTYAMYDKASKVSYTAAGNGLAYNRSQDFNTEEYSKINDNEFKDSKKNPLSTFSIDVDKASYSNVRRFLNQGNLPPADAVRVEEMINYFPYNYPQPEGKEPFSITTEYTECPWNNAHSLIHIGLQGKQIETGAMPANNPAIIL